MTTQERVQQLFQCGVTKGPEIANQLGVTVGRVYQCLRAAGVVRRRLPHRSLETRERVHQLFLQGLKRLEIAEALGITGGRVSQCLMAEGVEKHLNVDAHGPKCTAQSVALSVFQEQVLLGTLMGDAHLSRPQGKAHSRLELGHGMSQRAYMQWKVELLSPLFPTPRVREQQRACGDRCMAQSKASPTLTELRRLFYPDGVKRITAAVLDRLDAVAVAVWFMDDGSNQPTKSRRNSLTLTFGDLPLLDCQLVHVWFQRRWCLCSSLRSAQAGRYHFLAFGVEAAEQLAGLLRGYTVPSMVYKFNKIKNLLQVASASPYVAIS